jgi:hypothetical protein
MALLPEIQLHILEFCCQDLPRGIYWRGAFPKIDICLVSNDVCLVNKFWHKNYIEITRKFRYCVSLYHGSHSQVYKLLGFESIFVGFDFTHISYFNAGNDKSRLCDIYYKKKDDEVFRSSKKLLERRGFNTFILNYDYILLSLEQYKKYEQNFIKDCENALFKLNSTQFLKK